MDYAKFNSKVKMDELKEEIEKAGDVPTGVDYEVCIDSMKLGESKNGNPTLMIEFKIVKGKFKDRVLTMRQAVNNGYGIHNANKFLRSLDSGVEVEFEEYQQYGEMIETISKKVKGNFEYKIKYTENDAGYKNFRIVEVYELD